MIQTEIPCTVSHTPANLTVPNGGLVHGMDLELDKICNGCNKYPNPEAVAAIIADVAEEEGSTLIGTRHLLQVQVVDLSIALDETETQFAVVMCSPSYQKL